MSRGSFYTYFDDIDDFVRVIGVRAIQDVSEVVRDLPEVPTRAAMRRWLRRYAEVNLTSGPLVRVWIEAIEGPLRQDRAAVHRLGAPTDGDDAPGDVRSATSTSRPRS